MEQKIDKEKEAALLRELPDALAVISDYGGQAAAMLAYNGLLVLAVGVIYFILQERRCDSGA